MKCVLYVAHMETQNPLKDLVENLHGKKIFVRPRHTWEVILQ